MPTTVPVSWSYDVADSQFRFPRGAAKALTLTYTCHGRRPPWRRWLRKPVTVTVTGSNDAPTLAAELAGKLTDTAANDGFGNITGVLDGSDADHGETATLSYRVVDAGGSATNEPVVGAFGSLTVNADGTYTYIPNAAAINALHGGNSIDTFTVQTVDVHGAFATAVLTIDERCQRPRRHCRGTRGERLPTRPPPILSLISRGTLDGSDRGGAETATLSYGVVDARVTRLMSPLPDVRLAEVNADGTTLSDAAASMRCTRAAHRHLHGADHRCPRCRRHRNSDCPMCKAPSDTPSIVGEVDPAAQTVAW